MLIALGFSGVFRQFSISWFRGLQVCSFRKCSLCCIISAMACAVMFLIDKILNRYLATLLNIWGLIVCVKDGAMICTLYLSGLRCRSTDWLKLYLPWHVCVFRWEEEYTMRMDLQQKIADLQEVTLSGKSSCMDIFFFFFTMKTWTEGTWLLWLQDM